MFNLYYIAIRDYLQTAIPELENIDWYLGQFLQEGDDAVLITPAVYIRFQPITWKTRPNKIQVSTNAQIEIWLVSETAYGDERDMLDTTHINHIAIESKIFQALMNKRFSIQDAVPASTETFTMMESMVRTQSTIHDLLDNLIITTQTFQTTIYDISATPNYNQILIDLNCDMNFEET